MNPIYPVYIISKGRWESRKTVLALDELGVDYLVVVEPPEFEQYASVIDRAKLLSLPFADLGQGSIPARNFVWQHARDSGAKRHWILDDNIHCFYRLNHNQRVRCASGTIFRVAEDFVDRFTNVAKAGFNYRMFAAPRQERFPAMYLNTRVYSCILLDNALCDEFAWRGRYNEDTDLSLRLLKAGFCTVLFNAFLADKMRTMTMKGGNTDELYAADDGRLKMAESLVEQHPDVAKVSWKWGRWQHHVNYEPFRQNRLIYRDDYVVEDRINEFGMQLQERVDGVWRKAQMGSEEMPNASSLTVSPSETRQSAAAATVALASSSEIAS